jgi:HAD superfamily hydrolase (TIGR01490 family)
MEAAFFDLDKTVIARSSTLALGRPLLREGMISRAQVLKGVYAQLVYHLVGADEAKMDKMREALLELSKGWERDKLEALIERTVSELLSPMIYAEALELIAEHRAAGRRVYLVSSSGEEIVRPLARMLGVPHTIATRARVDENGRFTGELEFYCYGENKAVAMREHAARYGIDLAGSYAYSDSATDLPMLEAVGHPHAVNPDRELRAVALERGWPVLGFQRPTSLRDRLRSNVPAPALAFAGAAIVVLAVAWIRARRTRTV